MGGIRLAVVALMMLSVAFAGCSSNPDPEPAPEPPIFTPPPPVINEPDGPILPPCDLRIGEIDWTPTPPAPAPEGPIDVTIKRDAFGVAHIYADDMYALWYANGYVQASDRLFQMDVLRLVGYGTSASVLGPGQLPSDMEVNRELYTRAEMEAFLREVPEEGKQLLQAYADGVNRFILEARVQGNLPGEFAAIGRDPPDWTPLDSVAVIIYLIGFFGVDGGYELENLQQLARLEDRLGAETAWEAFGDLVWLRTDDTYTSMPAEEKPVNGCEDNGPRTVAESAGQLVNLNASLGAVTLGGEIEGEVGFGVGSRSKASGVMDGFKWGSNALLVRGDHTDTGQPIMWGAPQMGYYKPPVPYQVGLHGPEYDAAGIGVAGAPGLVIGRNAQLAWTATSGVEDMIDLVELPLTGERTYLWNGEERAMDCWTVRHQTAPTPADFAGFPDVQPPTTYDQEVCRADGWPVVAINEDAGIAYMQRTTTRGEELMGALKWLALPSSTTLDEFRQTAADFPFGFNFMVASNSSILYLHTGNIPIRSDAIDPRLPTPAGDAFEWQGEVYTGGMGTWMEDPELGYVANWNNAPAWGWRAGDKPQLWGPMHRVQMEAYQIEKRLAEQGTLGFDDVQEINHLAAIHDSYALPLLPYAIDSALRINATDVADALEAWRVDDMPWRDADGDGMYDDPAHAVWDGFLRGLPAAIAEELGDGVPEMQLQPWQSSDVHAGDHGRHDNKINIAMRALAGTTDYDWCDDVTTEEIEDCDTAIDRLLETVVTNLTNTMGPDVALWLEPVHESRFTSIGGANPDARPMLNKGSWVQVVAMGQGLDGAASALPPSNSGHMSSAELAAFVGSGTEPARLTGELDLYWEGKLKPFPLTPSEVDEVAVATSTLTVVAPLN